MNKSELWFILINISNKSKLRLIEKYNNEKNIRNNWSEISKILRKSSLKEIDDVSEEKINLFWNYINGKGIGYITIKSNNYPDMLKNIDEPPYVLFYMGNISLFKESIVAIVGSRNCTVYGKEVSSAISKELSKNNITIVSGVANGVDSFAQEVALENQGKTIGVLGCGLDIIYPKNNIRLYNKIARNGLLISEFLPGTKPLSFNFPRRNRIISALSDCVIVIEATLKSGSLITASYALEQGKDVIAIPGSVFQKNSEGCNKLIRDGAFIFTDMEDLYSLFNINKEYVRKNEENSFKNKLLTIISDEPIHLDDILEVVNVDRKVVFGVLFEMQNRNEIICLPGNYYAKSL